MQVLNGSFKEEVVQLGGLNWHLSSRNVYSPMWAGHCHCLGRKKWCPEGEGAGREPTFQLKCGPGARLRVVGSETWPTSVVFDQEPGWTFRVCVWSSAWRGGRGLSPLSCISLTGNCLPWGESKADACHKRVGFKRLICSWCLLRHFFFPLMVNCCVLCLRYLRSVRMYKETEYTPCDHSSQLADLGGWQQKCWWRFSLRLCVQGWGCIGDKLTEGHQFRRATAALQSFAWFSASSTVIWKSCACEQDHLLWTSSTTWKPTCKADMLLWLPVLLVGIWDLQSSSPGRSGLSMKLWTSRTGLKATRWKLWYWLVNRCY